MGRVDGCPTGAARKTDTKKPRLLEREAGALAVTQQTEAEGLEPPKACARRISSAVPYQLDYASNRLLTVGTAGFEPATPRSRSECSTGLSHVPKPNLHSCGADRVGFEPTRAINPTRFPIVLLKPLGHRSKAERRGRDSNPRLPFGQDGLANRWF